MTKTQFLISTAAKNRSTFSLNQVNWNLDNKENALIGLVPKKISETSNTRI